MVNNFMSCAISNNIPIYLCENVMCRLCGCTGNNKSFVLLKESNYLIRMIQNEVNVKIRQGDIFPKTVCRDCVDKVHLINHFKSHCRKTQKVLEEMHKSKTADEDLSNIIAPSAVQNTCDNNTDKTEFEDDSEMVIEWLEDEFSNNSIINNQNEQIEENFSKYGVMYNDTATFKSVHITVQDQNLPPDATIVPYKILGNTTKPRVHTYSKEELSLLSAKEIVAETKNTQIETLVEPVIKNNTFVTLNESEVNGPLLYRLLTSENKLEKCDQPPTFIPPAPKKCYKPAPTYLLPDQNIETIEEVQETNIETNENNNIIASKQSTTHDISPDERVDRAGRIFISNSHKYVRKNVDKEYSCIICNAKFRYPFQAEVHVRKHTGELPFVCKICGKSFITGFYLLKHEKTHNAGQFICEVCGKNFRQSYALKDHQRIHTDTKPSFKCEHCGKEYFTKANFDTHKLIHGEKKHICEICGKQFSLHSMMKRHQNRHKNVKFQCEICLKLSKTKEEYRQHKKRHEKNGLFHCSACTLSFWSKKGLQMHDRVRHHKIETTFETSPDFNNIIETSVTENIEIIYTDSLLST